jgi:hypothetical protein
MHTEAHEQVGEHAGEPSELETEVIAAPECEEIVRDCGRQPPIEIYEVSVVERKMSLETGLPRTPSKRHPDGYRN